VPNGFERTLVDAVELGYPGQIGLHDEHVGLGAYLGARGSEGATGVLRVDQAAGGFAKPVGIERHGGVDEASDPATGDIAT